MTRLIPCAVLAAALALAAGPTVAIAQSAVTHGEMMGQLEDIKADLDGIDLEALRALVEAEAARRAAEPVPDDATTAPAPAPAAVPGPGPDGDHGPYLVLVQ